MNNQAWRWDERSRCFETSINRRPSPRIQLSDKQQRVYVCWFRLLSQWFRILFCRQGWVCDYVNLASIASFDYICLLLVVVSVAAFSRRSEVEHETVPSRLRTEKSIVASPPARLIEDNFVSIHQKVLTLSIDWWGEMSRWCFLLLTDYVLSSVVKENLSPPSVPTKTIFYTYPTV